MVPATDRFRDDTRLGAVTVSVSAASHTCPPRPIACSPPRSGAALAELFLPRAEAAGTLLSGWFSPGLAREESDAAAARSWPAESPPVSGGSTGFRAGARRGPEWRFGS